MFPQWDFARPGAECWCTSWRTPRWSSSETWGRRGIGAGGPAAPGHTGAAAGWPVSLATESSGSWKNTSRLQSLPCLIPVSPRWLDYSHQLSWSLDQRWGSIYHSERWLLVYRNTWGRFSGHVYPRRHECAGCGYQSWWSPIPGEQDPGCPIISEANF